MHSLTTDVYDKRLVAGAAPCAGGFAVSSISGEQQAMEMTEYAIFQGRRCGQDTRMLRNSPHGILYRLV